MRKGTARRLAAGAHPDDPLPPRALRLPRKKNEGACIAFRPRIVDGRPVWTS